MQETTQRIAELPWTGLIPVAVLFLLGLVMWSSGRRTLRIVFAAGGLLVGCVVGLAATDVAQVADLGMPTWSLVLIGGVVTGIIALAAYRLVLAASIGVLLAGLIPLGVLTAAEMGAVRIENGTISVQQPLATGEPDWWDQWLDSAEAASPPVAAIEPAPANASVVDELPQWSERVRRFVSLFTELPRQVWESTSGPLRWIVVASAASGGVLGLFLGAAAPAISASVVTALGGSLLLLSSGWTIALRLHAPEQWLPHTTPQWLLWWMVAAVIGLCLQWIFRSKPADK
jgi:hypothetical protein